MDINFSCGSCGQHMVIDEAGAGLVVKCPKCGGDVPVPAIEKPKPAPAPEPTAVRHPEKEQTIALKWSPPSDSSHKGAKS